MNRIFILGQRRWRRLLSFEYLTDTGAFLIELIPSRKVDLGVFVSRPSLFIAIGVSKAQSMPPLPGVLPTVEAMAEWAKKAGYDTLLVTDQAKRVTVRRIQEELTPEDPATGDFDPALLLDRQRIVVYFCGHGLHAPQDQYWVLSAGPDQPGDRISSVAFRDALATYGPKQISIISDACRTAKVVNGLASSVVANYAGTTIGVQKDNFFSSIDGEASFSMPPSGTDPGYCVFSRVLLRALSAPPENEALDQLYTMCGAQIVSSQSLASYLELKVPDAALDIGKLQRPQCDPGFRPVENDYVQFVPLGPGETYRGATLSPDHRQSDFEAERIQESRSEWRKPYSEDVARFFREMRNDDSVPPYALLLSGKPGGLSPFRPERLGRFLPGPFSGRILQVGRLGIEPVSIDARPGVSGVVFEVVRGLVASERSKVILCGDYDVVAAIPLFEGLWCSVVMETWGFAGQQGKGVDMVVWGDARYGSLPPDNIRLSAAEALKGLSNGVLISADVGVLASDMRYFKHADPLYGIVSAYLYHRVGDVDNIRRMCAYYAQRGQDVPFDIAMLAQLQLLPRDNGGFRIDIPRVPESSDPAQGDLPYFARASTDAVSVDVAGVTPLLRSGWQHLEASPHRIHQACFELADGLTESPIASLQGQYARRFIWLLEDL